MDRRKVFCVTLISAAMLAPTVKAGTGKHEIGLMSAIPHDVFICTARRHSSESEFLTAYWNEVYEAFKATGAMGDVVELVGSMMGDGQKAEMDRLRMLATELFGRVDWCGLAASEFVFAERLGILLSSEFSVDMGPPEMVALFKGTNAESNFAGLVAIAEAVSDEINKAAGKEVMAVSRESRSGVDTVSITPAVNMGPNHEIKFMMGRMDDVIMLGMGSRMFDQSVSLMQGRSDVKSLVSTERFKKAFAELPKGTDGVTFFDMQQMLKPITGAISNVMASKTTNPSMQGSPRSGKPVDSDALQAYADRDYKKALELIHLAHKQAPDDCRVMYNVACFEALSGNSDEALKWLERSVDSGFAFPIKISNDSDLKNLREDPRFAACVKKAKEGRKKIHNEQMESGDFARTKQLIDRIAGIPGILDYVATVDTTRDYRSIVDTKIKLVPDAKSNAFYPVFGKRKPLDNFEQFIPVEATSFSVSGGIDLTALYDFIEESIAMVGESGPKILAQWAEFQQQVEFNVKKDLLSWLVGDTVTVGFSLNGMDQWVLMLKVSDGEAASQRVNNLLQHLSTGIQEAAVKNPMLAMMAIRTMPTTHPDLEGFQAVSVGMMPQPMACGVAKGHIMLGSSQEAVALVLATEAGKHDNIRKNELVMKEAVLPKESFHTVTYTDQRNLGKQLAQLFAAIPMIGGMATMGIPDPAARDALTRLMGIVAKLSPAAAKIDFIKSSGSYTTFDGQGWHARNVTNYASPSERGSATAQR